MAVFCAGVKSASSSIRSRTSSRAPNSASKSAGVAGERRQQGGDALAQRRAAVDRLVEIVAPEIERERDADACVLRYGTTEKAVVRRLATDPDDVVRRRGLDLGTVGAGEHKRPEIEIRSAFEVAQVFCDRVVECIGHVDQTDLAGRRIDVGPVEEARRQRGGAHDDVAADQRLRVNELGLRQEDEWNAPIAGEYGDVRARRRRGQRQHAGDKRDLGGHAVVADVVGPERAAA